MRQLLRSPGPLLGVVAFAALSLLLTSLVANTLGRSTGKDSLRLHAVFSDAAGLRVGDDVRIAGVRVGRVTATRLDGTNARVTFDVDDDQRLSTGTVAEIDFLNLMGQRYVSLNPEADGEAGQAGEGRLSDGDTIPLENTRPALDLTAMFNAFKPLFRNLEGSDLNQLAENLVLALQGQGPNLRDVLQQTLSLTTTVAERDDVIGRVLDNVALVLETTDEHRDDLTALVDDLGSLVGGLARDRRAISASIDSVQDLTSLAAGLVDEVADPITRDVARLRTWSDYLAGNTDALEAGLAGVPEQLELYYKSLGYGSHLNVYVCNLDIQVGPLPKIDFPPGERYSTRCRE